ncbi:hypothetical protein [Reyranella sp.]|jgi:hypothetical protein|uniref:hypothetical protein n=2 Tax=Reyranella sp. TaxID=1929291 RepID=UPI000BDD4F06|nr:hypothetical protein [Reyranella sp.]OYY35570.1 MAG: hypothetical protein B7Y57_25665 [Rhodospirillales bacterium 35-66-84]HQS15010.1 hypothetical protein [Reyranella sp.]HQT10819.1 hypothetical protein [Reyranella sp.]
MTRSDAGDLTFSGPVMTAELAKPRVDMTRLPSDPKQLEKMAEERVDMMNSGAQFLPINLGLEIVVLRALADAYRRIEALEARVGR